MGFIVSVEPSSIESRVGALEQRLDGQSGEGVACGESHISKDKTCRKGRGSAGKRSEVVQKSEPGKPGGGFNSTVKVTLPAPVEVKTPRLVRTGQGSNDFEMVSETETKTEGYVGAHFFSSFMPGGGRVKQVFQRLADELGVTVANDPAQLDVQFFTGWGPNRTDQGVERKDFGGPAGNRAMALATYEHLRSMISELPDGTWLTCTPANEDGYGDRRFDAYKAFGFTPTEIGMAAIVMGGKVVRPSTRRDSAGDSQRDAFIAALLKLPEFGAAVSLEDRAGRLDAKLKQAPGQLNLLGGSGQACGASHIAPALTCHKGTAVGKSEALAARLALRDETPEQKKASIRAAHEVVKSLGGRGMVSPEEARQLAKAEGTLREGFFQENDSRKAKGFRPLRSQEEYLAWLEKWPDPQPAKPLPAAPKSEQKAAQGMSGASIMEEVRRVQGLQADYDRSVNSGGTRAWNSVGREVVAALSKYQEGRDLTYVYNGAQRTIPAADLAGAKTPRDVSAAIYKTIGGTAFKDWFAPPAARTTPAPPAQRGNVVPGVNAGPGFLGDIAVPRRKAPAAPKPEQKVITAQEVETPRQQAAFARQQQKQAAAAGDQKGAAAWKKEERTVERNRVAAAVARQQTSQTGLFGVTEYDNTMPLFARRDAADPVGQMLQDVLSEQLPGSQVLDWEQHAQGVTSGRVAAEGLLYRFRCDGAGVGYRPAWDGLSERAWEARSQGFLEVRSGAGARMDFKKPKFTQLSSKRKCSTGYSCGSSCISLQKECRVTPKSAIGKQRLRQLAALAKEGDPLAKQQASAVETARLQKAFELREKRDVDQLKKLRERPEIAEFLRTGKLPAGAAAPADGDAAAGGKRTSKVQDISPDEIAVDPERFQYKLRRNAAGEVGSLKGVKKWDENLAGVISVWEDPADGKTYVVNGHNRLGLAKRLGAENVTVRYLDAPDAQTARAIGAMQNIAEGAGSEIDAAKFFRDTGIKNQKQVEEMGLPMNSGKAAKGLALAKLPPEMFNEVVQGNLTVGRGAIIGGSGLPMAKQREIGKMLRSRKSVSDGTLDEYVQSLAVSQTINQTTLDVFGNTQEAVDTGLARAELANGLRRKLAKERSLFATVSKSRAAEALQEKAGNVINQAESATVASEADQVLRVFNQMKNESGPISSALNAAAARVQSGESAAAVRRELEELVIAGMQEELERAGLRKKPTNEAPTASLFDSITLEDRLSALQDRLDAKRRKSSKPRAKAKCNTGTPCGSICLPPAKTCRAKGGAAVAAVLGTAPGPAAQAPAAAPAQKPAAAAAPSPRAAKPAAAKKQKAAKAPPKGDAAAGPALAKAAGAELAKALVEGGAAGPATAAAAKAPLSPLAKEAQKSVSGELRPLSREQIKKAFEGFDPAYVRYEDAQVVLGRIYEAQGFNARPERADSLAELKQRGDVLKGGPKGEPVIFYRGVTEKSFADQFRGDPPDGGSHYPGLGVTGSGSYAAAPSATIKNEKRYEAAQGSSLNVAKTYAGISKRSAEGMEKVTAFTIKADAVIGKRTVDAQTAFIKAASEVAGFRVGDEGIAAAILGVDAYVGQPNSQTDYWVILNRGAIVAAPMG